MKIKLSDHFTYGRLLRFTLPSIVMMVFTSIYGVVDGIFVSNFAGKTAFAAVNLVMPVLMMLGVPGFMLGTGGTALISKTLGEKDKEKASSLFSMLTLICILSGVVLTVLGMVFMRPIAKGLGAAGQMLEDCVLYGRLVLPATTAYILQFAFQSFCVAAEKPNLSLAMMVTSGLCNIALDALWQPPLPSLPVCLFPLSILPAPIKAFCGLKSFTLTEKPCCAPVPTALRSL